MSSTLPYYEKQFSHNPNIYNSTINNVYAGHFRNYGTREGRAMTAAPSGNTIRDRYKTFAQLEKSLPPGIKEKR